MKKSLVFSLVAVLMISFLPAFAAPLQDGMKAYYQKNWASAEENFRQAMEEDPNDSLALAYYVVSNFWQKTSEHLMQALEERINDSPNDQLTQIRLAFANYMQAYRDGAKPDKAWEQFHESARLGPSPLIYTGLGMIYFDVGNFSRSEKEFAHALDINPNDILAQEYMGRILLTVDNNPQLAQTYFQHEVDQESDYPDGHYYLALADEALGNTEKAIAEYQTVISLDSLGIGRGLDAEVGLGDLYAEMKDYNQARQAYQAALKFSPDDLLVKKHLNDLNKSAKTKK